jgi:hypothetical protein
MEQTEITGQARCLLAAERDQHLLRPGRTWFVVVTSAVANLVLGTHFESLASDSPGVHYFLTFLLCESVLVCLYVSLLFFSEQLPILMRTRIFPLHAGSRIMYLCWGAIRRPIFILFMITGGLVVGVMYRRSTGAMVVGPLLFASLLIALCVLFETGYLFCLHRGWPTTSAAAALVGLALAASIVGALVPHGSLLSYMPMIAWVGDGVTAAMQGSWGEVILNGVLFLIVTMGLSLLGRRYG